VRKLIKGAPLATLFFSYSHADENLRDQLEKHLSALKRQGAIKSWHDRQITAGKELNCAIDANLNSADIILLLISPDFIDSEYCYDLEMKRAMERHQKGEVRVIPVILRPCDWHGLVFGKLLATPTDGKPVTKWANIDEAFLEVVKAIKGTLSELGKPQYKPTAPGWATAVEETLSGTSQRSARSSNLRVKKNFTDLDRDQFIHDGFEYIAKFFENSLKELVSRNPGLEYRFKRIDANRFTAAAYQGGGKVCKGSASVGNGVMSSGGIQYSMTDEPTHGGMNESVSAKTDDQTLYFQALGMQSYGRDKEKLTMQGAAELFWDLFIRPLQE
jgi:TIR domain